MFRTYSSEHYHPIVPADSQLVRPHSNDDAGDRCKNHEEDGQKRVAVHERYSGLRFMNIARWRLGPHRKALARAHQVFAIQACHSRESTDN